MMLSFLLRRVSLVVPTFLGVVLLSFVLVRLVPGDPVEVRLGEQGATPEQLAQARHELGLDRPLPSQFLSYVSDVLHGDLGRSLTTHEPVWDEFTRLFPATLELAGCALLFAVPLGLLLGTVSAVRRESVFDYGLMGASVTGASMPIPWWGMMLILLLAVHLGWLPVSGRISAQFYVEPATGFLLIDSLLSDEAGAFASTVSHLVLPTIVLGTIPLAVVARMTRSCMIEALGEEYTRTARAKGVPQRQVVAVHALRNAMIPIVTVIGLQVGALLSGAILTETIFSWPGVGTWLIDSVNRRDYQVLQGGVLLIAGLVMLVNLGVDLAYGLLNPRTRR